MKPQTIQTKNTTFVIEKLAQGTSEHQYLRELLQNSIEAQATRVNFDIHWPTYELTKGDERMNIALDQIHPSPDPVRKTWDDEKLQELTESIREQGVIVPIKVRPNGAGYEIVYGHRRVTAAKQAGLVDIPALIESLDDDETLQQAFTENINREDMTPLDIAKYLDSLMKKHNWTRQECGKKVGWTGQIVGQHLFLLEEHIQPIAKRMPAFTSEHIRSAKRGKTTTEEQTAILEKAAKEDLSRRQIEKVAASVAAAPTQKAKEKLLEWEYSPITHNPDTIRQRAKEHGAHDPFYQDESESKKTNQKQWDDAPEIKVIVTGVIEAAKAWTTLIKEIQRVVNLGKIAPEGKPFLADKLRTLATQLLDAASELERKD